MTAFFAPLLREKLSPSGIGKAGSIAAFHKASFAEQRGFLRTKLSPRAERSGVERSHKSFKRKRDFSMRYAYSK